MTDQERISEARSTITVGIPIAAALGGSIGAVFGAFFGGAETIIGAVVGGAVGAAAAGEVFLTGWLMADPVCTCINRIEDSNHE